MIQEYFRCYHTCGSLKEGPDCMLKYRGVLEQELVLTFGLLEPFCEDSQYVICCELVIQVDPDEL